ncbi:MAG TPA: GtrA family protein [Candidatus Sphingobacterium stercoripullorum]|uniref:GtrA family protein n=1 Tax=Candidatus Sphingobacterium stercoripullorum TaxID=2838759 RepID=A0A9D1W7Q5_9SPHI|nr:GtrA family protein [Candidatus Sphingobacterium stercoripullorum]
MKSKKSFLTFFKAQASAFIGGLSDYAIMLFCTEVLGIHYTLSIVISGTLGAVVNFSINKYWTFKSPSPIGGQLVRFVVVVLGSIALKSSGTYLVTEFVEIDYKISRIIVELVVSLLFNYPLQRYWVFKK